MATNTNTDPRQLLLDADCILVNSSAGKDSQAMLDYVAELARELGILDRVVVVHCDLGRVEWGGTRELAERQAAHYGFRFEIVARPQGDLLDQVTQRHQSLIRKGKDAAPWPSSAARWCTSDQKRGQVATLVTALANEYHGNTRGKVARPFRVLNCLGLRAQESNDRAKLPETRLDKRQTNARKHVTTWHPILEWTTDDVWARIAAAGTEYHQAYDLGMGRLSCCFCPMAPRAQLLLAAEHNRALLDDYVAKEREVGWQFTKDISLAELRDDLEAGERGTAGLEWAA